jgi:hypothetical protein
VFVSQNNAGLRNPQQLSFDEHYLYVSSYDNNRILRYDSSDGNFVDEFIPSRDHRLQDPVGNVLDKIFGNIRNLLKKWMSFANWLIVWIIPFLGSIMIPAIHIWPGKIPLNSSSACHIG